MSDRRRERVAVLCGAGGVLAVVVGATWILRWLELTSETVTVAGNVAVTLTGLIIFWYTLETSRLRRQSAEQTQATREQARITRQIFEASQRPFLELIWGSSSYFNDKDHYRLECAVKNHGPVPAVLRRWVIKAVLNGETVSERVSEEVTRALFVGDDLTLKAVPPGYTGGVIRDDGPELNVAVTVEYESPAGLPYASWLNVRGRWARWAIGGLGF